MKIIDLQAESGEEALKLSHRLVALHIAGVALMICLVLTTAVWMAYEHNRLALRSSEELVDNEIASLRARAFTLVRDYSLWDEGYQAALEDDRAWLYSNIGSSVTEVGTFDLILISVPDGRESIGWVEASPEAGESDVLPPDVLSAVFGLLDNGPPTTNGRTLFAEHLGEPWVFSISRMTPVTGAPAGADRAALPRQIHGWRLTEDRVEQMGTEMLLEGLRLTDAPEPHEASLPLVGHDGRVITNLAWVVPRPGASILRAAAVPLALALGIATLVSGISSYAAVRSARRLEKALHAAQAADRSKSEFLSNVSHELRTPMNGVLGAAQLLQTTELDLEQGELVGVLLSSANAQMSLISDLIDLSRIDAGTIRLSPAPFEPVRILTEVSDMMKVTALKKQIRLETDWREIGDVTLRGDGRAFRQVVTNLIGNAVKFTDQGTVSVTASLRETSGRAQLTVRVADTGPGIPEASLSRIFDRFYQVDSSMSRSAMGTGLGLAISQRLAHLMGGEIEVASKLGLGSTFNFRAFFETLREPVEQDHAA